MKPRTITQRGREIVANSETPLTLKALAEFLHLSRSKVYGDVARGYRFEFGRLTTPGHYRDWCRRNPLPLRTRKNPADPASLERELSQLH